MEEKWNVILYKTLQGDAPVREFILSLEVKTQSKVEDSHFRQKFFTFTWIQEEKK